MAKQGQSANQNLDGLTTAARNAAAGKGLPPVHLWNPPFCGDLDMRIAADGLTPYLHVRADLWAKVTRALYYDLVDMGEERVVDGRAMFGVASAGEFFAMADAEQARQVR